MKKTFRAIALAALALPALTAGLHADTIPGGDVFGTWYAANSPYYITGDITIQASDTLVIEPGVQVNFQGLYSLTVNGLLEAVGTETDSIHFFPADISVSWYGILFMNAPDSSHLAYCTVRYTKTFILGYGGIRCTNSNPVITHCRISNNSSHALAYAGGIALNNSNAKISWCNINNNFSQQYGGGIYIYNSSPVITGCNISGNEVVQYGGGIRILGNSSPIITNCNIENNTSYDYGGGIWASGSAVTISECTVGYNHADTWGGGISIHSGSVFLDHCIIERNNCLYSPCSGKGGGIFTNGGVLTVDHCTFYMNEIVLSSNTDGMEIHTEGNAAMTVTNSIFLAVWDYCTIVFNSTVPASVSYDDFTSGVPGSGTQRFMGNVPPGLGVLTQVNANGDSCDVYYNIFLDPLFVDSWDHHLTENSPCIDAGDTAFAYDPDGTITDIGAYWFDQRAPAIALSDTALDFGSVYVGEQASLGLNIYNQGTANLLISGLANSLTVFITDYDPADSLILPGDSLALTVTFSPADTASYCDTLNIANNDQGRMVILNGVGQPTGVAGPSTLSKIPASFRLCGATPNPARGQATIAYQLPKASRVTLEIYDIAGRMVKQFDEGVKQPGHHSIKWNAREHGAGVYFCRLRAGAFESTKKAVIVK